MNRLPDKHFVTVDVAIFRRNGEVLLIKRKNDPFKDHWALPGGFVDLNEDPLLAARRELAEETGLIINTAYLCISKTYNNLGRDPRGPVISICYTGLLLHCSGQLKAGDDAEEYTWSQDWRFPIAFDHKNIIEDARNTIRFWEYMKLPELDASANYPIKSCPEGFEAKALLIAWSQQLLKLLHPPGANLAEINACINRLVDIAHQATECSRPEEYNNDTQENETECSKIH